jgi:ribosomal protein S20
MEIVKEKQMTDEEKKRMEHLERVESAAKAVMKAFGNSIDYDSWDKALDKLETVLKEKP